MVPRGGADPVLLGRDRRGDDAQENMARAAGFKTGRAGAGAGEVELWLSHGPPQRQCAERGEPGPRTTARWQRRRPLRRWAGPPTQMWPGRRREVSVPRQELRGPRVGEDYE